MKSLTSVSLIVLLVFCVTSYERKSQLKCDEILKVGEYLESDNGYYAVLQDDCDFVIYASKHFVPRNIIWKAET